MSLPESRSFSESLNTANLSDTERAWLASHPYPALSYTTKKDPSLNPKPSVYTEDGGFFEDFANGIDPAHWYLMRAQWGFGNNGVIPENISYTDDGVVVFRANGDWYTGDVNNGKGTRTGAVLTSTRACGPGIYETRMKTVPKMGSCSALWTYFGDGDRNHEIDIELPGNNRDFLHPLFTNWLREDDNAQACATTPPHNDGEWHTYRFDWHTSPPRVDYYVDGKLELTVDHHVPTVAGLFNVGIWVPIDWCGHPLYQTAYMLVDWVRYTPFDEPYEPYPRPAESHPIEDIPTHAAPLPVNNFVADGTFEAPLSPAWKTDGDVAAVSYGDTALLRLQAGAAATQYVSSVSPNVAFALRFAAASDGGQVKTHLRYESADGELLAEETLCAEGAFSVTRHAFTAPAQCAFLRLTFESVGGTGYVGDVFLTQPVRGDFVETI